MYSAISFGTPNDVLWNPKVPRNPVWETLPWVMQITGKSLKRYIYSNTGSSAPLRNPQERSCICSTLVCRGTHHALAFANSSFHFLTSIGSASFQVDCIGWKFQWHQCKTFCALCACTVSSSSAKLKNYTWNNHLQLQDGRTQNNEEVKTAVREWLKMQNPGFYRDGIFELVDR